jgi:hypothetical protein
LFDVTLQAWGGHGKALEGTGGFFESPLHFSLLPLVSARFG